MTLPDKWESPGYAPTHLGDARAIAQNRQVLVDLYNQVEALETRVSKLETPTAPPPSGSWGDGQAFMDRPVQPSNIVLRGADDVVIENLLFDGATHPNFVLKDGQSFNAHVAISLYACTNITIRNCDFNFNSQPIAIFGGSNITIEWCRAYDIIGPSTRGLGQVGNFLQTVNTPSNVILQDTKIVAGPNGDTEDIISFYSANNSIMRRIQIDGTGWSSTSGTGFIMGDGGGNDNIAENISMLNPGQAGATINGGLRNTIKDCVVYRDASDPSPGLGNVGSYMYNYGNSPSYGDHEMINNRVRYWSDYQSRWNGIYNPDSRPASGNYNDDTIDPADLAVTL